MSDSNNSAKDMGVLTWEHFVEDEVQELWRVLWLRKWGSQNQRVHRCTDYFWFEDSRGLDSSIRLNRRQEDPRGWPANPW